jgi:hypothetical protein
LFSGSQVYRIKSDQPITLVHGRRQQARNTKILISRPHGKLTGGCGLAAVLRARPENQPACS